MGSCGPPSVETETRTTAPTLARVGRQSVTGRGPRVACEDERVAQFERRPNRSWDHSSQLPSADSPTQAGQDPSGRKQGAQPAMRGVGDRSLHPSGRGDGHLFVRRRASRGGRAGALGCPRSRWRITKHRSIVCSPGRPALQGQFSTGLGTSRGDRRQAEDLAA